MKVHVTIPDGPFADALVAEAAKRNQSEASLIAAYTRTMLNKYGHAIELEPKIKRGDDRLHHQRGESALHVRASASGGKSSGGRNA